MLFVVGNKINANDANLAKLGYWYTPSLIWVNRVMENTAKVRPFWLEGKSPRWLIVLNMDLY